MQQAYNELVTYKNSVLSATKNLSDGTIYTIVNSSSNEINNKKIDKSQLASLIYNPVMELYQSYILSILTSINKEISFFKDPDTLIDSISNHKVPLSVPENKLLIDSTNSNIYNIIIAYFEKIGVNVGNATKIKIKKIVEDTIYNDLNQYKNVLYATSYAVQQINTSLIRRKTDSKKTL